MESIFERLTQDHQRHRALLQRIEEAVRDGEAQQCRTLFASFRTEVEAHAAAEEQSLYADMLAVPELQPEGRHSVAEHKIIDDLIGAVEKEEPCTGGWRDAFAEMKHCYLHHIDEEEEEVFAAARQVISKLRSEDLAERFDLRKPEEVKRAREAAE